MLPVKLCSFRKKSYITSPRTEIIILTMISWKAQSNRSLNYNILIYLLNLYAPCTLCDLNPKQLKHISDLYRLGKLAI